MLRDLTKSIKSHHVIAFAGIVLLVWAIGSYSTGKGLLPESMSGNRQAGKPASGGAGGAGGAGGNAQDGASGVQPSNPLGQNEQYASAQGVATTSQGLPPSCSKQPVADPAELLPKDTNSQWAQLNPSGQGDLKSVNLLKAGWHNGIDTVGNTLRNANLQVRSEPANPQTNVGPWNNTTIAPDTTRTPLELGQGAQ